MLNTDTGEVSESDKRWACADDVQLAAYLAVGQPEAIAVLYDRYGGLALGLARRLLGNDPHGAQDVVQEAFLSVWRGAATFDSNRASLRTWLCRIVRHRCIDRLRSQEVRPLCVHNVDVHGVPDPTDVWREVDENLTREHVQAALHELPAAQREAISLAYFSEFTFTQIAHETDVPLSTVKGRMRLGIQHLRTILIAT